MNKITGKEELKTPIFFLFIFSLMLGVEMGFLNKNLNSHGSIILFDPILFEEKILGTIHIALGDNSSFGGKVRTSFQKDFVFFKPTVTLISRNGARSVLLKDGKLSVSSQ